MSLFTKYLFREKHYWKVSAQREFKVLNKLMNRERHKNITLSNQRGSAKKAFLSMLDRKIPSRRACVLNKTFMRHITDIMSNGKHSSEIHGLGIEITNVQISDDFSCVKVFWMASENKSEITASLMQKLAKNLEHEISTLGFMGKWPNIDFVKDCFTENSLEVNKIIDTFKLNDDKENFEEKNSVTPDIKPMRHDVLGLDHSAIMKKIQIAVKKKDHIDFQESKIDSIDSCTEKNDKLIPFSKEVFSKFCSSQAKFQKNKNQYFSENLNNDCEDNYDDNDDYHDDDNCDAWHESNNNKAENYSNYENKNNFKNS